MLAVIVLNYMDYKTTKSYVMNIVQYKIIDKIIIVDNNSPNESFTELLSLKSNKIDVIKSEHNGGYGYGNNYGIRYVMNNYNCDYICISNPDVEISNQVITECISFLKNNDSYALVVPFMLNDNGKKNIKCVWRIPNKIDYLLFSLPIIGRFHNGFFYNEKDLISCNGVVPVECVAGSWLMIDSNKMLEIGMYDENIFLYCEETVLGIKLKNANYKSALLTNTSFIHHHSVSIDKSISSKYTQRALAWKSRLYILKKYYSSNLLFMFFAKLISYVDLIEYRFYSYIKYKFIK